MNFLSSSEKIKFEKYMIENYGDAYTLLQVRQALISDDGLKLIIPKEAREAFFGIDPEDKTQNKLSAEPHEMNLQGSKHYDTGLDETSSGEFKIIDAVKECDTKELIFRTRYYHIITKEEAEKIDSFNITIPEKVIPNRLVLIGKDGHLSYGDHYLLNDDGITITIYTKYVSVRENDLLELYIYDYQ